MPAWTILPPSTPAPGPKSITWSACADRLLVVLDHDHGVPDVAHAQQRLEQAPVVALVQADRGLVEDVDHPGQLRAHLARQPDALGLAAGERRAGAVEREVAEAHRRQEVQPARISFSTSAAICLAAPVEAQSFAKKLAAPPRR